MSTAAFYRGLAEAQGVARPFDILVRMHPASRRLIADLLGCRLGNTLDPYAQAWRVINQNLRGLQARTHTLPEQLTPFSRNNNWWEIVTRTARRLGVRFYPGVPEQEVERLVFERFAQSFAQTNVAPEREVVDALAEASPDLQQAMMSMQLSPDASRSVLSALAIATARHDQGLREGCQTMRDWLRAHLRWQWAVSISTGLRILQGKLTDIYRGWTSRYAGRFGKVSAAVAVIYFQDLVDRTLEEFDCA
jgi:hypothetical protein